MSRELVGADATVQGMDTAASIGFDGHPQEVTIDVDARAAYIRLRRADVASTKAWNEAESVIVDLDADERLIGIEILGLNTEIPIHDLARAFGFSESLMVSLKEIQQSLWQVAMSTAGATDALVPAQFATPR
jgi:uncharacterized protein YuzE